VLGSVRQLADASGAVILGKSYQPYGKVLDSSGSGASSFGFTGEWTDATGLINLRARYYAPGVGRFISRDTWEGNDNQPMSYNDWLYTYSNPTVIDPSGASSAKPGAASAFAITGAKSPFATCVTPGYATSPVVKMRSL